MAAGLAPTTLQQINQQAGTLALQVHADLLRVQQFKAWLDATPDATLLAAPFSMAQADINTLRSAFVDLNTLANVYQGLAAQTPAYDFRTFAKQLYGFGVF